MPAYLLSMMTIHDPETYRKYTDRTPPVVKKYGGKFLTRGEPVTCLEGEEYSGRETRCRGRKHGGRCGRDRLVVSQIRECDLLKLSRAKNTRMKVSFPCIPSLYGQN